MGEELVGSLCVPDWLIVTLGGVLSRTTVGCVRISKKCDVSGYSRVISVSQLIVPSVLPVTAVKVTTSEAPGHSSVAPLLFFRLILPLLLGSPPLPSDAHAPSAPPAQTVMFCVTAVTLEPPSPVPPVTVQPVGIAI